MAVGSQAVYIVNQFVGQDPNERPPILAANPAELEAFAEDGVAIDTATLFRMWRAVQVGELEPHTARDLIRMAKGRFVWPPEEAERAG